MRKNAKKTWGIKRENAMMRSKVDSVFFPLKICFWEKNKKKTASQSPTKILKAMKIFIFFPFTLNFANYIKNNQNFDPKNL